MEIIWLLQRSNYHIEEGDKVMELKRKAIRVGLSASLCMLVSTLLKLKFPFFVLLPAVMPISTFFGETIKFGINRIIGSIIGAIIGVLLVIAPAQNILVLLVGIGVILIVYICDYLKWDSTTSIACLVFCSIIVGTKGFSAIDYSFNRLLDTFIGIGITTIVNNYVFNPDMIKLFKKESKGIQESLLLIAQKKDFYGGKNELDSIESHLNTMKEQLKIYIKELRHNSKYIPLRNKLENLISTLSFTFEQIKIINYINDRKEGNITIPNENIDYIINIHKKIFFNEMINLDKIMEDII